MVKYKRNTDNIHSKIDDEVVMVNVEQGNYYSLNRVGSSIWELLETPKSVEEICSELMNEYEINEYDCKKEVESFVEALLNKGVIDKL